MQDNLKQDILKEIENSKMRPRYVFILKTFGFIFGFIFFIFLAFYLFAFVGFLLAENGLHYSLLFGPKGVQNFLVALPWKLLLISLVSLLFASIIFRKITFQYKKHFTYTLLTIIGTIVVTQIIFVMSGVQKIAKEEAFRRSIPLAPPFLNNMRDENSPKTFIGKVVSTTSNSIIIENRRGKPLEIRIESPELIQQINLLSTTSEISVFGEPVKNERDSKDRRPPREVQAIEFRIIN